MMMNFLKDHPFAVEAHFDHSIVLTFAVPKAHLEALIPPCLSLDTFNDEFGFIAIALVQTTGLRPKGFPSFLGNNFFLIGYRIFVRYQNNAGKNLRGLYILKSETDKKKMEFLGNIFTHYNYTTTDIQTSIDQNIRTICSKKSDFDLKIDHSCENVPLPAHSPFPDWKAARRFAGPLPFTFTYNAHDQKVLIVEGVRENWTPKPLHVLDYKFDFLEKLSLPNIVLANCFIIENIPYFWKKGKVETWKK